MNSLKKFIPKKKEESVRLNLRQLPTKATGLPAEFLAAFSITAVITGLDQVNWTITERARTPGAETKAIPIEEAMKLARAPGFVRASEKDVQKDELTTQSRALFFQAREADINRAKNPKALVQTIKTWSENLVHNKEVIDDVDSTLAEDQGMKNLMKALLQRANTAATEILETKLKGDPCDERATFIKHGVSAAAKSKLISNKIILPSDGKFWTTIMGKPMTEFLQLSVHEIRTMPDGLMTIYNPYKELIKLLKDDDTVAKYHSCAKYAEVPEALKERFEGKLIPCMNRLNKLATFERCASTKERPHMAEPENSPYNALEKQIRDLVTLDYFIAPLDLTKVKEFWATANDGVQPLEPIFCSRDYRSQTIDALHKKGGVHKFYAEPFIGPHTAMTLFGRKPSELLEIPLEKTTTAAIYRHNLREFQAFQPRQLISSGKNSKEKMKQNARRRSVMSKESSKWLRALGKEGATPEMVKSVQQYLEEFWNIELQEMAARIVYMTCRQDTKLAQYETLGVADDSDAADSSEEDDEDVPPPLDNVAAGASSAAAE